MDFSKLIPKDRVMAEEDKCLEMILKGGRAFYVPVNDGTQVNSFYKWEQAFRVFSNVYTKFHPNRSSELIEYNHVIHTISQTYVWDNVYMYDKDFKIHMSHNPQRNWSIILQQAWSLRLKDKLNGNGSSQGHGGNYAKDTNWQEVSPGKINEPCRRYNKGRCPFGPDCHYEHHCSYCFKFGHSVLHCRKLQADSDRARKSNFERRLGGGPASSGRENKNHGGHHKASENASHN